MTLQDYAKYLLSACGRRFTNLYRRHYLESTNALPSLSALLSYLRTQTATIYAHLFSRGCTQSTPTFANLLPTIHQLDTRKVEVGTSTQVDDGVSLVRLLCDYTKASMVTELKDDVESWLDMRNSTDAILSLFPNCTKLKLRCKESQYTLGSSQLTHLYCPDLIKIKNGGRIYLPNATELQTFPELKEYITYSTLNFEVAQFSLPKLETVQLTDGSGSGRAMFAISTMEEINLPSLVSVTCGAASDYSGAKFIVGNSYVRKVIMPKLVNYRHGRITSNFGNCPNLEEVRMPSLTNLYDGAYGASVGTFVDCPKLLLIEIGNNYKNDLKLNYWSPTLDATNLATFRTNFQTYILNRLSTSVTGRTLTVSASVFAAVSDLEVPAGWTLVSA